MKTKEDDNRKKKLKQLGTVRSAGTDENLKKKCCFQNFFRFKVNYNETQFKLTFLLS